MNKTDILQLKEKLLLQEQELQELESTLKESAQTVELDQSKVGRLSRMDAIQGQQIALDAARRRKMQFKQIKSALHRIDADEYGFCLSCGDDIDTRRLSFDPANEYCFDCADKR